MRQRDSAMSVVVTTTARVSEVAVAGELDCATAGRLRRCLETELALAPRALVIDFDAVTFCGVEGLRVLIDTTLHAKVADVDCALVGESRAVWRLFKLFRLEQTLPLRRSSQEPSLPHR